MTSNLSDSVRIAVIGGGVTGLIFGLAALRDGYRVDVFERSDSITDVGAGISFNINAAKVFESLGLGDVIDRISYRSKTSTYRTDDTNELKLSLDYSNTSGKVMCLRAEFVREVAALLPKDQLRLGKKFESLQQHHKFVTIRFKDGSSYAADLVIGADGINSQVRSTLFGESTPVFSHQVMYRDVLDLSKVTDLDPELLNSTTIIPAPGHRHVVLFPLKKGTLLAVAAIIRVDHDEGWEESWLQNGSIDTIVQILDDFHPSVKKIFSSLDQIKVYGLYEREPLSKWYQNRVALAGDAAHAMLPHQGQGGSQGVEDAYALALTIGAAYRVDPKIKENIPIWLEVYESARKIHAEQVALTPEEWGMF